jgi:hypothetical protein
MTEKEYQKNYREKNKERLKEKNKKYYIKNKDKILNRTNENYKNKKDNILKKRSEYRKNNSDKIKITQKKYREKNKEEIKKKKKLYYEKNKNRIIKKTTKYKNNKIKNNYNFKLRCLISHRIKQALKGNIKYSKSSELLGCSLEDAVKHLESQFKEGMTWGNHGVKGWHIDHIKPCASFNLSDPEEQKKCFHYTNLQPLWWHENLSKGDKV